MLVCKQCGKEAELILNVCSACDPELHKAWAMAVKSAVDFETVTPEMVIAFELLQRRKLGLRIA